MDSTTGINSSFARNKFFTATTEQLKISFLDNLGQPYTKLKPNGSGIIDVVNTMYWKNLGSNDEVPSVWVTERELKFGCAEK